MVHLPDSTTVVKFTKFGQAIQLVTLLELIARKQYHLIRAIAQAGGDGPATERDQMWVQQPGPVVIRISPASQDITLSRLRLAEMLEGIRLFFLRQPGAYRVSITVMDKEDVVGIGSIV